MEQWKALDFTNELYEVSNKGRVRNAQTGRILKNVPDGNRGYLRVVLFKHDKKKHYKAHRLVAHAFVDNPNDYSQVNHIDGNKLNNTADNLEWCTNTYNMIHAKKNGLMRNQEKYCVSKRIPVIATNILSGESIVFQSITEAKNTIGSNHIQEVLKGTRKQCKGYTFSYLKGGDAIAKA